MTDTVYSLIGGDAVITQSADGFYEVLQGEILIFIAQRHHDEAGRRYYLGSLGQGYKIPSIAYKDEEGVEWCLVLLARESGQLSYCPDHPLEADALDTFVSCLGITNVTRLGINEALAETYRYRQVKDNSFLYQTEKDRRQRYSESLDAIRTVFDSTHKNISDEKTTNDLYKSAKKLCGIEKIQIAEYETIAAASDGNPRIDDIARLSNFVIRRVTLEDNWYKKDLGSFLAYQRETKMPVVLQTRGAHRYRIIFPDGRTEAVTEETVKTLEDTGWQFYAPLPEKSIRWRDVIFYYIRGMKIRDFIRYLSMMLLGTGIGLLVPELNQRMYDLYIPQKNVGSLLSVGLMILAFSISNILFNIVGSLSSHRVSASAKYSLEGAVYHRLMNLPLHVSSSIDSGELASRVMGIAGLVSGFVDQILSNAIAVIMSILYLARMFGYSPMLSWACLVMTILYIAVTYVFAFAQMKYIRQSTEIQGELNANLFQYLRGMAKIRLSGSENNVLLRYTQKYAHLKRVNRKGSKLSFTYAALAGLLSACSTAVLYYLMAYRSNGLSSGGFIGFNSAFGSFYGAILSASGLLITYHQIRPELKRSELLLKTPIEIYRGADLPGQLSGDIEVSNVTFSYEAGERPVLFNLSCHIKSGEYVGIVGASGCGKSTLLKLLMGFEKPTTGRIYYDGRDIDKLDKRELRKKIGIVLQNGRLIAGSIQENIAITSPGITYEMVNDAIDKVGLREDIDMMPMGIHTMVSDDAATISGGQRQRVLIARALASNPKIVMFDEATSALDNVTQSIVCDTLEKMKITRIVIAHRLSTVMHCDRIFVMDHGKVVEEGTYEELIERKGLFFEMAERQIA